MAITFEIYSCGHVETATADNIDQEYVFCFTEGPCDSKGCSTKSEAWTHAQSFDLTPSDVESSVESVRKCISGIRNSAESDLATYNVLGPNALERIGIFGSSPFIDLLESSAEGRALHLDHWLAVDVMAMLVNFMVRFAKEDTRVFYEACKELASKCQFWAFNRMEELHETVAAIGGRIAEQERMVVVISGQLADLYISRPNADPSSSKL